VTGVQTCALPIFLFDEKEENVYEENVYEEDVDPMYLSD
jgi:hypothetical protein